MTYWSVERLRPYLQVSTRRVPEAAASIAWRRGGEFWAGTLSAGKELPAVSLFPIWSITKSLTAVVTLRLVAEGRIELDSRLASSLDGLPHADKISVRQCLQHTSGWADYGSLPEYHAAVRRNDPPWTFWQFLGRVQAERLLFEPGTAWAYSNIGYMVVRRLIETVSHQSFADTVKEEVCKPLALIHTSIIERRDDFLTLTMGHSFDLTSDGHVVDVRGRYDIGWAPTGVAASTASEVVRFYDSLFSGRLLPASLLTEMCKVIPAGPSSSVFVSPSYGLGLMADPDYPVGPIYGHNGEGPGYTASAFHCQTLKGEPVTVAVLTNTEHCQETQMMALHVIEELSG
jgi:D-alanyl-D-alanine carboxypeptidase